MHPFLFVLYYITDNITAQLKFTSQLSDSVLEARWHFVRSCNPSASVPKLHGPTLGLVQIRVNVTILFTICATDSVDVKMR